MATFTINRKGGYEIEEVDAYINSLEQQLREYKDKSSVIEKAIISAQLASDTMMKKANEETASVVKKATDEAANIVKKANDEAEDILAKANAEKAAVMAETEKCKAALAENADKQIRDIKNNITQQKSIINSFNKEYKAMVDKYIKAYDPQVCADLIKDLDDIDGLVSDWAKNGIPDLVGTPKVAEAPAHAPSPLQQQLQKAGVNVTMPKTEVKHDDKPEELINGAMPSPLTASSVTSAQAQDTEDENKDEQQKTFIKTGLAGNGGMAGIPANPSYGLGGERTLKNSVNHSETKATESAPEPVNSANITVPKFGAASTDAASNTATNTVTNTTSTVPAFASALSSNGANTAGTASTAANAAKTASTTQADAKPGIYKVSSDNKLYNDNNGNNTNNAASNNTASNAVGGVQRAMSGMGLAPSSTQNNSNNNVPKPGIYKIGADNKLTNNNSGFAPKAEQSDAASTNTNNNANANANQNVSNLTGMSKPGIYKVTE